MGLMQKAIKKWQYKMTVAYKVITTQGWSWTPMWRIKQIMFHVKHCETHGNLGEYYEKTS